MIDSPKETKTKQSGKQVMFTESIRGSRRISESYSVGI